MNRERIDAIMQASGGKVPRELSVDEYLKVAYALSKRGAHLMLVGAFQTNTDHWDPKKAAGFWRKRPKTYRQVEHWMRDEQPGQPRSFGLVPASVDLLCIDADLGGNASVKGVVAVVGKPIAGYVSSICAETGHPKWHLLYRFAKPRGNCGVHIPGRERKVGELRGENGYVRLPRHLGAALWAYAAKPDCQPTDPAKLLREADVAPGGEFSTTEHRKRRFSHGGWRHWDCYPGNVHNELVRVCFTAGLVGDENTAAHVLDDALAAYSPRTHRRSEGSYTADCRRQAHEAYQRGVSNRKPDFNGAAK